jgi:hypothetical protein
MAKSLSDKYTEAVERNLKNAKKSKYAGMDYEKAKMKLGIRKNDYSYQKEVEQLIAQVK